ncbi:MAG TPA: hypothetical protein VIM34_07370, partial [Burkholderiaceae bacterium]
WWKYLGDHGDVIGLDRYGESAPAPQLFEHFGISAGAVAARALALVRRHGPDADPAAAAQGRLAFEAG